MDIEKIKLLREKTGVSYSICQKALKETGNDLAKAEELLIQWGAKSAAEKTNRKTASGGIFSYVHHNQQVASLIEINTETDFVANNEEFKKLGYDLAMQIASLNPQTIDELLEQSFIKQPSQTVKELLDKSVLKFGENIKINRFIRWQLGDK